MDKISYSTFEIAKQIGVSAPTVIKWCNSGLLKCYRTPGGHRRITLNALQKFSLAHDYPLRGSSFDSKPEEPNSKHIVIIDADMELGLMIKEYIEEENDLLVHLVDDLFTAGLIIGLHKPAVVVVDINQSHLEGFKLSQNVKKHISPNAKLIAYSAFIEQSKQLHKDFDAAVLKTEPVHKIFDTILMMSKG